MANKLRTSAMINMLLLSFVLLGSATALAQSSPDWNRRVLSFELTPPDDVEPLWTARANVSVTGFTAPADGADGSLQVQYLVNGALSGEQFFSVAINTPGNCNCTSGCDYPGGWCDNSEFGCWCGVTVTPNLHYFTNKSLNLGDEVTVRIVAADGSVAEQFTADDEMTIEVDQAVPSETMAWSTLKTSYH